MKKLFTLLALALLTVSAQAQHTPRGINYQAVARTLTGEVMADQAISLRIALTSRANGSGTEQYSEVHTVTTNNLGLFTLVIGEGQAERGTWAGVTWSSDDIWMDVAIREPGRSAFTTVSSSKLLAVPYAIHALTAGEVVGGGRISGSERPGKGEALPTTSGLTNNRTEGAGDAPFIYTIRTSSVRLPLTTQSTANDNGALVIDGGVGIGRNLNVGGNTDLDGNLDVHGNAVVDLNSTVKKNLMVNETGTFTGILRANDPTESVSKTTGGFLAKGGVGIEKNLSVGGNAKIDVNLEVGQQVRINSTTESTASNNGALTVAGGTGVGKNLNVGGNANLAKDVTIGGKLNLNGDLAVKGDLSTEGVLKVSNTTNSTSTTTGALQIAGGAGIAQNLFVGGSLSSGPQQITGEVSAGATHGTFNAYNLQVQGSNNGIAVKMKGTRSNAGSFVAFFDENGVQGRIKGQNRDDFYASPWTGYEIYGHAQNIAGTAAQSIAAAASAAFPMAAVLVARVAMLGALYDTWTVLHMQNLGVAYSSGAGDYAEYLEKANLAEGFAPGDIVGVKGGRITKTTQGAHHLMVISHFPAVIGKEPQDKDLHRFEKVAFMGQVPVKVRGIVHVGDYIVPLGDGSGIGVAVSPTDMTLDQYAQIVGVAWSEAYVDGAVTLINLAVGINTNDVAMQLQRQQSEIDGLRGELNALTKYLAEKDPDFKVPASVLAANDARVQQVTAMTNNIMDRLPANLRQAAPGGADPRGLIGGVDPRQVMSLLDSNRVELFREANRSLQEQVRAVKQRDPNSNIDQLLPELERFSNDENYMMSEIRKVYSKP